MNVINNPILRGFNPDPNIVRVGDDYYIATSTFEWFPGVQIHHSKDLVNWQLIGQALTTVEQLDMKGVPDSCGVWAPQLSYHQGMFYLIYSNVKSFDGQWKDTPNYLVSTDDITKAWSPPTLINASGFDPSLFHDDDGKSYFLNMIVDHRNNQFFGGIIAQEIELTSRKLIGQPYYIFSGSEHGRTEGPHLYKRNGYYYLLTAEGGTSYEHCISIARAKSVFGPYEIHPENPILTAKNNKDNYLQKTGHGDFVQTPQGDWYAVFLTGRPLSTLGRCITGRETAIEQIEWRDDGWPYTGHGSKAARVQVPAPNITPHPFTPTNQRSEFNDRTLDIHFQSLRVPVDESWLSLSARKNYLRLFGRESLSSCHEQSLIARRITEHHSITETCLEFSPENFQQLAGLVCYYNTRHYYYLHVSGDSYLSQQEHQQTQGTPKKYLSIISCDNFATTEPVEKIVLTGQDKIYLKADFNGASLQFYFALEKNSWQKIGPVLDGSILSDDYVEHAETRFHPCFTGAFVGLACQDLSGQKLPADFEYFDYQTVKEN
ncbi:MAG: glycoside hydrolase family 43 protein [Thalassotalea sp.]